MHVSSETVERGKRVYVRAHGAARFERSSALRTIITGFSGVLLTVGLLVTPVSGSGLEHGVLASQASSCSGVRVLPGADLQAKINSRPGGTTFCLKKGIHPLVTGAFVKSYDRIIGEPGAVLDGQNVADTGLWGYGGSTGQRNVVVAGVGLKNFRGPAIKTGWNWVVSRNNIRNSEIGVAVSRGTVLRGNFIHHNALYGINGGPTRDVLIENNEVAYNNSCDGTCGGNGGGSKIVGSVAGSYGVVWRGNWVHDNKGPGIWSDGNVHNVLYEDNVVEGNSGPGIFHEISWDATIRNNVVRWNSTEVAGKSCWWGSQIHLNNSQNVRIVGNQVRSGAGANGICLVDVTRSESAPFSTRTANVDVRNNTIHLSGSSMSGLVGTAARSVTFDWNTYYVADPAGKSWAWYDRYPLGWRGFRARGQEGNGTLRR